MKHLAPSYFQRPDRVYEPLHVMTPLYNSARYRTRWEHAEDFFKRVEEAGAILHIVEIALGDRAHAEAHHSHLDVLSLRTKDEMFFKEAAQNLGVQRLPSDWKYVALIDADVRFARDDWANETVQRLQHYAVVQMWSEYMDLSADCEQHGPPMPSFAARFTRGELRDYKPGCHSYYYGKRPGYPGAPGLAWAYRRDAWNTLGGMLDTCILGAGDWYMAHGLCGVGTLDMVRAANHQRYRDSIFLWWERALELKQNVGVVPGLALHSWHGPKAHRKYGTREQILIDEQFDPARHLSRDWQGLWQWTAQTPVGLRDKVRNYLHERREDA